MWSAGTSHHHHHNMHNNPENQDIDFEYADADDHTNEMAEWYCYSEEQEIRDNESAFRDFVQQDLGLKSSRWSDLTSDQKTMVWEKISDGLDLVDDTRRWRCVQCLTFLMQGTFSEVDDISHCFLTARRNVFAAYEAAVFPVVVHLMIAELEETATNTGTKRPATVTLSDSYRLRLLLTIVYTFVEVMRVADPSDSEKDTRLRNDFRDELNDPITGSEGREDVLLSVLLFQAVNRYANNSAPVFPIRKILLLLWKVLLVSLGGWEELLRLKNAYRQEVGLPDVPEHTLDVVRTMRPASPPINANEVLEQQNIRKLNKPLKRQMIVKQTSVSGHEPDGESGNNENEDIVLPQDEEPNGSEEKVDIGGRPASPLPSDRLTDEVSGSDDQTLDEEVHKTTCKYKKGLHWRPKVRTRDMESFVNSARLKFFGFQLANDWSSTFGLPDPILESVSVMSRHVYVSLSEVQVQREEELAKFPLTMRESSSSLFSPTEQLYRSLLPNLSQCVISLLKILLSASPTSRSKAQEQSMNLLSDCLPHEESATTSVVQSLRLGIDVSRHKEVIIKAVTGILILLLKHLKASHVYQFEYMSQQLMFANCIPLVLKFLNQNVAQFVESKNTIPVIDFPVCVIGEQPELTAENLDAGCGLFCWRNLFSCINLCRVLNKLTKWKHSRIMMLVVFKSAPILKKSLRLRHPLLQLLVLKLLKIQSKYLGRQWRKSNMKTMSAIYQKVRHRLTDDWAFGNDVDSRPWDFQAQEFALQSAINRFHHRRYSHSSSTAPQPPHHPPIPEPESLAETDLMTSVDNCLHSVLSKDLPLPQTFRDNYEQWLETEVFGTQIDWDLLLSQTDSSHSI